MLQIDAQKTWSCRRLYQEVFCRTGINIGGQHNSALVRTFQARGVPYSRGALPRSAKKTLADIDIHGLCDLTLLVHLPGGAPSALVLRTKKKPCPVHPADRQWIWEDPNTQTGLYYLASDRKETILPCQELARFEVISNAKQSNMPVPDMATLEASALLTSHVSFYYNLNHI